MNRTTIKVTGISVGVALLYSLYHLLDRRKKDKKASDLIQHINQQLKPNTAGLQAEKAFDIFYLEDLQSKVDASLILLKTIMAQQFAKEIHSAWAWWGDDENKVYGVFRRLKDKAQVAQVAKAYQELYKVNLIDQLSDRLNKKEVGKVLQIVQALPDYRTF